MIGVSTSPFHVFLLRKLNTWYSVKDGNWSDPNTWISNGLDKKSYFSPQPGDNVYVNHNVNLDTGIITTLNNLFIAGKLTSNNGQTLIINGNLQASGAIDFTGSNISIQLFGIANYINSFIPGNSTVIYSRLGTQPLMDITYNNLTLNMPGSKYAQNNLTITGGLIVNGAANGATALNGVYLDTGLYSLTVNGTTGLASYGTIRNTGGGYMLFVGSFNCDSFGGFDMSVGNPTIEFRGGVIINNDGTGTNTGTGQIRFTTDNQSITAKSSIGNIMFNNPITVENITLTNNSVNGWYICNSLTGTTSGSTLNNDANLALVTTSTIMATGIFNYIHGIGSTMTYAMNTSYTLPFTSYINLTIISPSVKTLSGDTSISSVLTIKSGTNTSNPAILDCTGYNLSVTGQTSLSTFGTLRKSASGNIIFIGGYNCDGFGGFDWTGNPLIEFRGNVVWNTDGSHANSGTGAIRFTTNNITLTPKGIGFTLVSNPVTVENINLTIPTGTLTVSNINGTTSSSTLINQGTLNIQSSTEIMTTGIVDFSTTLNTVQYNFNGNQDIKAVTYRNLTLSIGGIKKLLGNVSVQNIYTLASTVTLNSNGFALTNP